MMISQATTILKDDDSDDDRSFEQIQPKSGRVPDLAASKGDLDSLKKMDTFSKIVPGGRKFSI